MSKEEEKLVPLSSIGLGKSALLVAFSFGSKEGERVHKMGLVPGEKLEVVRVLPIGDMEIKMRGYFLSLSKKDVDCIMVKPLV